MSKYKTQPWSGKSDQHNFCQEEGKMSGQTSSKMRLFMYYTQENVFNMSATWECITKKYRKKSTDTGCDSTVISSFI